VNDLADTQRTWTVKTTAEVGLLLRGSFVSSLKEFCFMNDIKLMMEESKGWLESSYFIKAETRDYSKVLKLKRFIEYMEL
jgi:hypothetical protein